MSNPGTVEIKVDLTSELRERFDRIDASNKRIIELRLSMLRWTITETIVLVALLVVAAVGL